MTREVEMPSDLQWLDDASMEERVDWLVDRRVESIKRERVSGRFYRLLSYIAVVLVCIGLWLTVHNTRIDARRAATAEARRIAADTAQVQYSQCISTANGRASIRQVLTVLISQSPNSANLTSIRALVDDPNGPLAPPVCTPPISIPTDTSTSSKGT